MRLDVLDFNRPAGLGDELTGNREPEPHTLARLFGREERLEEPHHDLRADPGPSVLDNHVDLALGERRALAVRNYLIQLGVSGDRLVTISYGKEFPAVPGNDESAWAQNRRAEFNAASK